MQAADAADHRNSDHDSAKPDLANSRHTGHHGTLAEHRAVLRTVRGADGRGRDRRVHGDQQGRRDI